jgi:hypothetical protein
LRTLCAGVKDYSWQSSPARGNGVYHYKKQWGATEATYQFLFGLFVPPAELGDIGPDALCQEYPLHFIAPYFAAPELHPGVNCMG